MKMIIKIYLNTIKRIIKIDYIGMINKDIIKYLVYLPEDILFYIFPFISIKTLVAINKNYYTKNHKLIKQMILPHRYESYIRNTIRKDHAYTLSFVLNENVDKWVSMSKYYYNHQIFTNYLYFISYLSIENNSTNCRKIIEDKAQRVLGKKWHKKVKTMKCKWNI